MPNRADNVAASTKVTPAGHAAVTTEEELGGVGRICPPGSLD